MSQKRLNRILDRDGYICGLHAGGCYKKIDPLTDEPSVDHIFSKDFIKHLPNRACFRQGWNYQAMCKRCNEIKGGQGIPSFHCNCHYIYITDDGKQFVYYKERFRGREKWRYQCFHSPDPVAGNRSDMHPNQVIATFSIVSGQRGKLRGFSAEKGKTFGHILSHPGRYKRLLSNSLELLRVGRGRELALECNKFRAAYKQGGLSSLSSEARDKTLISLAEFYYLDTVALYCIKEWNQGWVNLGNDLFSNSGRSIRKSIHERLLTGHQPIIDGICTRVTNMLKDNVHYLVSIGVLKWNSRPRT